MRAVAKIYARELVALPKLAAPADLVDLARHLGFTIRYGVAQVSRERLFAQSSIA
jgi:hypothetical protein